MKCTKCKKEIPVGNLISNGKCETCAGIINPYDNPDKYKYFWCGKLVSLEELPSYARKLFPTLDMYK